MIFDSAGAVPDALLSVLHALEPPVDPYDEQAALEALMLVRRELDDRIATGDTQRPDIVVVLTELGQTSAAPLPRPGPLLAPPTAPPVTRRLPPFSPPRRA